MGGSEGRCCVSGIRAKGDVKLLSQEYRAFLDRILTDMTGPHYEEKTAAKITELISQ